MTHHLHMSHHASVIEASEGAHGHSDQLRVRVLRMPLISRCMMGYLLYKVKRSMCIKKA